MQSNTEGTDADWMNHPEEISKMSKLKAQVTEVKGIMMDNIEKVHILTTPCDKSRFDCLIMLKTYNFS